MAIYNNLFGLEVNEAETKRHIAGIPQVFGDMADDLVIRKDAPMLHVLFKEYTGLDACLPGFQGTGDCTSWAKSLTLTVQGSIKQRLFTGWVATEPIYGGSRVEIGKRAIWGAGSLGSWCSEWVTKYGVLYRKSYGSVDLTEYSSARADGWGRTGVPDSIEPSAREILCRSTIHVTNAERAAKLLTDAMIPFPVNSGQGFTDIRDSQGFARPSGRWPHSMGVLAVRFDRPGFLIVNSWPKNWISGPTMFDQPPGSFWCDWDVFDRMLKSYNDSFGETDMDGIYSANNWGLYA